MARERRIGTIDAPFLRKTTPATLRRFDKGGDNFYDQISALHKSVRGSDPDAALYWLMRMLDGGCDPRYIARRLMRMSVEDIGLADPRAMDVAVNAAEIYERLGSPEGDLALGEAAVYLACAPKSNAIEVAMNELKDFIRSDGSRPVPMHLRNAPTKLMKDLGYKEGYRYAHDEPGAFAAGEIYLPEGLEGRRWYHPTDRGTEARIAEKAQGFGRTQSSGMESRQRTSPRTRLICNRALKPRQLLFQPEAAPCAASPYARCPQMRAADCFFPFRTYKNPCSDVTMLRKNLPEVVARLKTRQFDFPVDAFN